jgi:4-hydroxy-3-polyprenylbenzoate decarboxylase
MKRIIVGISGASGVELGLKLIEKLPSDIEKHVIISEHAKVVIEKENVKVHDNTQIYASVASGSFKCDAMLVVPCSMNTLAKITNGIADNLITRAASVMIKERRTLLLAPREMPFSPIALENMHKLSLLSVIIAPPVLAYYSEQSSLEEMEDFMIGKWLDLIGIDNDLFKRWDDE